MIWVILSEEAGAWDGCHSVLSTELSAESVVFWELLDKLLAVMFLLTDVNVADVCKDEESSLGHP